MENNKKMKVYFGREGSQNSIAEVNYILITPSNDGWNDFGFQSLIDIHFHLPNQDIRASFPGYIGFLSLPDKKPNGAKYIREFLASYEEAGLIIPAESERTFFTMLREIGDYRKIAEILGRKRAIDALLDSNDLVAHKEFKSSSNWLRPAIESSIFQKSFIRNHESYYSFKNSGTVLRGIEDERISKLPNKVDVSFKLDNFTNEHNFSFKFDYTSEIPKRTSIIIGENGVGKSQTLGKIASFLSRGKSNAGISSNGERVTCNRLLAFAPTSESTTVFPGDRSRNQRIKYKRFDLNRKSRRSRDSTSETIVDIARSLEKIGRTTRWDIFSNALSQIEMHHQICLPAKLPNDEPIYISTLDDYEGEERQLEKYAKVDSYGEPFRYISGKRRGLSSGEISFLRFISLACLHIDSSSLILLDEPETHLHPRFISQFFSILDAILYQTGSAAIIATHSAYIVREVAQDQVHIVKKTECGSVLISNPSLRTFGADIGAISFFVFDEDKPSKTAALVEAELFKKHPSWESFLGQYGREMSLETLGSIRDLYDSKEEK